MAGTTMRLRALTAAGILGVGLAGLPGLPTLPALGAGTPLSRPADVRLKILVFDDGSPMLDAVLDRLDAEGVPVERIDLTAPRRPRVTASDLAAMDDTSVHAHYSGIVLPSPDPPQLSAAEQGLLHRYAFTFKVRQLYAYAGASPLIGTGLPVYAGPIDGTTATVTAAGKAGSFGYLRGPVAIDDDTPGVTETWADLADPAAPDAKGTPLVMGTSPDGRTTGPVIVVRNLDGREVMSLTMRVGPTMTHWRVLGHGVVDWLTRGISTSYSRNYFSMHVDDILLSDKRWDMAQNCTMPGCPTPSALPDIRMTAADVDVARAWQKRTGVPMEMAFNGNGTAIASRATGTDPLTTAFVKHKTDFRWLNHTYAHIYLGCRQDTTARPWRCVTESDGSPDWQPAWDLYGEIQSNLAYAEQRGLPGVNPAELVTGEHSGLARPPQQPVDNPNLATALTTARIGWVASNGTLEPMPRQIGSATTVPRWPVDVSYDTGTKEEVADQYNWWYSSRAAGGSGWCEDTGVPCLAPLDTATGYDKVIATREAAHAWARVIDNDPRPHFAHAANLTEDRLLYPVMDGLLSRYRSTYAANTPLVVPRMSEAGAALMRGLTWREVSSGVTAIVSPERLTLTNDAPTQVEVPVTAGARARTEGGKAIGAAYAGRQSGWLTLPARSSAEVVLGGAPGFARVASW